MSMHVSHTVTNAELSFTDAIATQERLWRETIADNCETERDSRLGGQNPIDLNPKLMHDIQALVSRLVAKAKQLLDNETTNLAECWMHIRCKFDGGKVINRSQSGSWEYRCMGAGLQQNLGKEWGPKVWSSMTGSSPNQHFTDVAECFAEKADRDRKRKATKEAKEQRRQSKYCRTDDTVAARKSYSRHDGALEPDEVTNDIPQDYLAEMKQSYYNTKVVVTQEEAMNIETQT